MRTPDTGKDLRGEAGHIVPLYIHIKETQYEFRFNVCHTTGCISSLAIQHLTPTVGSPLLVTLPVLAMWAAS